jgi:tetratricopeptide (TPR) repeat protein
MKWEWLTIAPLLLTCCAGWGQPQDAAGEVQRHEKNAKTALDQNNLLQASQEYQAILRLEPKNADVYTALGVALYGSGKLSDAVTAFESALRLNPLQNRADLFLGLSEADLGQCAPAIPILKRHFPSEPDLRLRRLAGLSLLDCERESPNLDSAHDVAQRLKATYPDDPDVLYKLAELYTRLWNQTAGELMEKHPESYRVHQLAGEVFEAQGKLEQSIKEYRLALQENGRIAQIHYRIGQLLRQQGGPGADQRALNEFEEELAVNPQASSAEYAIAEIYHHQQSLTQAAQHYTRAAELDPDFAEPHVGLAQIWLAQHNFEKSLQELQAALRLQPNNSTAHYTLMVLYRDQDKMVEAGREQAAFQRLKDEESMSFETKLHSLLTGSVPAGQAPRQ